ncbi:MAG TPA: IS110 family transposase [Mycobacteriales bacterium]|nr:IS110 family transposase [Mycobacteriales bacterium]
MPRVRVTGGVDTHLDTHHAAALDQVGRVLGTAAFPVSRRGFADLLRWLTELGELDRVGIEGTGSYGATLTRFLAERGVTVIEVDRPNRKERRRAGKSDPIDAINAARAVQSGAAAGTPKLRTGPVEAIRVLRVERSGAVKARVAAWQQLNALLVTAPLELGASLQALPARERLTRCARMRIENTEILTDPHLALKTALRRLAARIQALDSEIAAVDVDLSALVAAIAPSTLALFGVGTDVAGQLLVTAGDNPDRLHSDAAFARLCGVAPIPASSGRTNRHRLHRGGDRQANRALYITTIVRLGRHQPTRDYMTRRREQGLTKREIIRCLKRYLARELLTAIRTDFAALDAI